MRVMRGETEGDNSPRAEDRCGDRAPLSLFTFQENLLSFSFSSHRARCARAPTLKDVKLDTIKLPPGFTISVYAEVPGARSMTMGPGGTLFVGTRDGLRLRGRRRGRRHEGERGRDAREGPERAQRRRREGRRALRRRGLAHPALRRDRGPPEEPRPAGRRDGQAPEGRPPRLEVHRVRAGRLSLRARRRSLQHLQAERPVRLDRAHASRTGRPSRSSRAACGTRSGSTGIPRRRSCGSRTTGATGWTTTRPPTS